MKRNERELGFWMSSALIVGNMVGSGIFLLPASLAPFGLNSITGWGVTVSGAILLAIFARLSRGFPRVSETLLFASIPLRATRDSASGRTLLRWALRSPRWALRKAGKEILRGKNGRPRRFETFQMTRIAQIQRHVDELRVKLKRITEDSPAHRMKSVKNC